MTDQRADTPQRTRLDELWDELLLDALASDGPIRDSDVKNAVKHYRSRIEEEVRAATEPAAAEPPDLNEAVDRLLVSLGLDPDDQERWEAAYSALHDVRAAQPPRGSLPDQRWWHEEHVRLRYKRDGCPLCAGGSLTATARPTASEEPPDEWCNCDDPQGWHTHDYEPPPRGVTLAADRPALDVERLDTIEEVFDLAVWIVGLLKARDGDKAKPGEAWEHIRPAIKAVAARLGSPEGRSNDQVVSNRS